MVRQLTDGAYPAGLAEFLKLIMPTLNEQEESTPTVNNTNDGDVERVALERYRIVAAYLQYENTIYWQRGQLFLVASAALFGFASQNLPLLSAAQPIEEVIVCLGLALAGLVLANLWHRSLRAGEFWVHHWHDVLRSLEPQAFGEHRLFRNFEADAVGPARVLVL